MTVYYINSKAQDSSLVLTKGSIYRFDQSTSSNDAFPLLLSVHPDGRQDPSNPDDHTPIPESEGVSYWLGNGVATSATYDQWKDPTTFSTYEYNFLQIEVPANGFANAPDATKIYYYSPLLPGMGGELTIA